MHIVGAMKRRDFVGHTSLLIGSSLILPGCFSGTSDAAEDSSSSSPLLSRAGVQLYTLRSLMAEDVRGTLESVAELGLSEVEFAGYFGHEPAELRGWLDELGLQAPAAHVEPVDLGENLSATLDAAEAMGHRWIILAWMAPELRTLSGYQETAALLNQAGAAASERGIRVAYHNHAFEFEDVDGRMGFDILAAETDPAHIDFELDFFWLADAGKQAKETIEQHAGRVPLCHVKDRRADGSMVAVGEGDIDWAEIIALSEVAGLRHYFIEHDNPSDPLASVGRSARHLLG